jgi:three-Cys-motif partner protein
VARTVRSVIRPGGAQTRTKLSIVGDYLPAFTRASSSAPARVYIDAFAGAGRGVDKRSGLEYDGSAALALTVEPPFTQVFLIEQDELRAESLEWLALDHPNARVVCGDANAKIPELLSGLNTHAPTLAFLDPEGTELHWATIEALARHKHPSRTKIELMILFPLQMAVLRLLNFKGNEIPLANRRRLDAMLGAESPWREIVRMRLTGEIAGPEETELAFLDAYADGLHRRLGYKHVLHREVEGDSGRALYYLVFASDSDVGRRIARWDFGASHTEQGALFNVAEFTEGLDYDPDRERPYRL